MVLWWNSNISDGNGSLWPFGPLCLLFKNKSCKDIYVFWERIFISLTFYEDSQPMKWPHTVGLGMKPHFGGSFGLQLLLLALLRCRLLGFDEKRPSWRPLHLRLPPMSEPWKMCFDSLMVPSIRRGKCSLKSGTEKIGYSCIVWQRKRWKWQMKASRLDLSHN